MPRLAWFALISMRCHVKKPQWCWSGATWMVQTCLISICVDGISKPAWASRALGFGSQRAAANTAVSAPALDARTFAEHRRIIRFRHACANPDAD